MMVLRSVAVALAAAAFLMFTAPGRPAVADPVEGVVLEVAAHGCNAGLTEIWVIEAATGTEVGQSFGNRARFDNLKHETQYGVRAQCPPRPANCGTEPAGKFRAAATEVVTPPDPDHGPIRVRLRLERVFC